MSAMTLGCGALALALVAAVQWFRAVHQVALPQRRTGYMLIMLAVSAAAAIALTNSPGWLGGAAAVIALTIAGLFLLTVAISKQVTADDAIKVGDTIPAFTATDENGESFDSIALAGNPALIKFFRGHW